MHLRTAVQSGDEGVGGVVDVGGVDQRGARCRPAAAGLARARSTIRPTSWVSPGPRPGAGARRRPRGRGLGVGGQREQLGHGLGAGVVPARAVAGPPARRRRRPAAGPRARPTARRRARAAARRRDGTRPRRPRVPVDIGARELAATRPMMSTFAARWTTASWPRQRRRRPRRRRRRRRAPRGSVEPGRAALEDRDGVAAGRQRARRRAAPSMPARTGDQDPHGACRSAAGQHPLGPPGQPASVDLGVVPDVDRQRAVRRSTAATVPPAGARAPPPRAARRASRRGTRRAPVRGPRRRPPPAASRAVPTPTTAAASTTSAALRCAARPRPGVTGPAAVAITCGPGGLRPTAGPRRRGARRRRCGAIPRRGTLALLGHPELVVAVLHVGGAGRRSRRSRRLRR